MIYDKEHPALLVYTLGFFLLLTIVGYLMLLNSRTDLTSSGGGSMDLKVPSYQNLFSPE